MVPQNFLIAPTDFRRTAPWNSTGDSWSWKLTQEILCRKMTNWLHPLKKAFTGTIIVLYSEMGSLLGLPKILLYIKNVKREQLEFPFLPSSQPVSLSWVLVKSRATMVVSWKLDYTNSIFTRKEILGPFWLTLLSSYLCGIVFISRESIISKYLQGESNKYLNIDLAS